MTESDSVVYEWMQNCYDQVERDFERYVEICLQAWRHGDCGEQREGREQMDRIPKDIRDAVIREANNRKYRND